MSDEEAQRPHQQVTPPDPYGIRTLPDGRFSLPPAKFTINPVADTLRVNTGGAVTIRLYVTGWGGMDRNKLFISFSSQELLTDNILSEEEIDTRIETELDEVDSADKDFVERNVITQLFNEQVISGYGVIRNVDEESITDSRNPQTGQLVPEIVGDNITGYESVSVLRGPTLNIKLGNNHFWLNPYEQSEIGLPGLVGESSLQYISDQNSGPTEEDNPPISLHLNINENAPPDDYTLRFAFTYWNRIEVVQKEQELTIHVNSWVEQHRVQLQQLAVGVPVGILAVGILQAMVSLRTAGFFSDLLLGIGIVVEIIVLLVSVCMLRSRLNL